MPCHSCFAEFGLLKKEIGCEVCGFSFCSRCCKKHQILSDTGDFKKKNVCNNCHENTSDKPKTTSISPPLAHKRRMETFKKQSFSVDSGYKIPLKSSFEDEKDKEIAERLNRLKRERMRDELPSENEIEERLAILKGIDPSKYKAPPIQVFRPSDKRTSCEKADDLLIQMKEEVDLDLQLEKPEDEIADRLARLRNDSPSKKSEQCISKTSVFEQYSSPELVKEIEAKEGSDTESDIEEEANKLVEKLMATNMDEVEELESSDGQDEGKGSFQTEEEEFPWCTICSEDAKIRCFGCDGDLYCMTCFKEGHDSFDMTDHKTCPYLHSKNPLL